MIKQCDPFLCRHLIPVTPIADILSFRISFALDGFRHIVIPPHSYRHGTPRDRSLLTYLSVKATTKLP